ncbi:reverse transcriptase domain-containing protein [Tanacetum coccineum]
MSYSSIPNWQAMIQGCFPTPLGKGVEGKGRGTLPFEFLFLSKSCFLLLSSSFKLLPAVTFFHFGVLSSREEVINSRESPWQGFTATLAILITGASQSRHHNTLVRLPMDIRLKIDLGKSVGVLTSHLPQSLFDVGSGRISIVIVIQDLAIPQASQEFKSIEVIRNEELQTELEYFSEDYDEEGEMKPRPEPTREVTPPLRTRSPRVRRQRKRVVEFEEAPNREGSRTGRNTKGNKPSEAEAEENERREMNLPPLLAAHLGRNKNGQPLQSSLIFVHGGRQSLINIGGNLPPNGTLLSHHAQPFIPSSAHVPNRFVPTHANPTSNPLWVLLMNKPQDSFSKEGLFTNATGSVTPFVRWIEDYPLPDGLKMPSHVGSYNEKGDPDNFLHLFEGAIRMQKWLMPVACHMFTYTLKDSARIWWNSLKAGSILNYEDLKAKFRSHFSQQKRFTKTHLAVHSINKEKARVPTHGLKQEKLPLMEPRMIRWITSKGQGNPPRTMKGDIKVETCSLLTGDLITDCSPAYLKVQERFSPQKRSQFEIAVKSGQLSHLVKGIKKERTKTSDNQQGEKKEKNTTLAEAPILMINHEEACTRNFISKSPTFEGREITFPLKDKNAENGNGEGVKKIRETSPANIKGVLSCTDAKEKIIINNKYPEQTVTIGKRLPEHFKERLRNLLRTNADVFAWTHAHMIGIPRTITVNGKPFNTEHKLNEYSHIKPIKQKRRSLGPDRSTATRKEVEELTRAGILWEAAHQK